MKRFYQLQKGEQGSDDEEAEEDEDEDEDDVSVSGSEDSESDEEQGQDVYDPMRGRGVISGSDSDEESDIDEEAAAELDREAAAQEDDEDEESEDDVPRGDESHRFACVNLDWDHVKVRSTPKIGATFNADQNKIYKLTAFVFSLSTLCSQSTSSRSFQDSSPKRVPFALSRSTPQNSARSVWSARSVRDPQQRFSKRPPKNPTTRMNRTRTRTRSLKSP